MTSTVVAGRVTGASPPSPIVAVRLLGPVVLEAEDGSTVEVPSATQRRLVALLALRSGRTVRPDHLADVLGLSAGALRKAVSRVRAVVGDGPLARDAVGYRLDLAVDADRFAAAVRRADGHDPAARLVELDAALAWWHGDPLDEFAGEAWAQGEATRLDELHAAAVAERAELLIAADRSPEALADLGRQVARRPLDDRPRLLQLRALAAAGRSTEALRLYQQHRALLAEAGTEPSEALRVAEQRIALGWDGRDAPPTAPPRALPSPARPGRLPVPSTSWIGPLPVVRGLAERLVPGTVVTLTGPGGVGKTRLALEAAHGARPRFADGVRFVDLATVSDHEPVLEAVAAAVGSTQQAGESVLTSLLDRLAGQTTLLVLDNAEHVLGAANDVVRGVLDRCPSVAVLVTSRVPLGVDGEAVVPVAPLPTAAGVELFRERAHGSAAPAVAAEERAVIATICEQLDGLPLAVELAAARARTTGAAALLAELDDRFGVLRTSRPERDHRRTLWDTVDWSYRLLPEHDRLLFDRLSVFAGPFDEAAARSVCGGAPLAPADVAEGLTRLVDRSMVAAEGDGPVVRHRLLETLRQFGEERLAHRRQVTAVGHRHLDHYLRIAEAAGERWLSPEQLEADAVFDREWGNLRAAHAFAVASGDRSRAERLVAATIAHCQLRMRTEHWSWCQATAALGEAGTDAPVAVGWAAWWTMVSGDHEGTRALCDPVLAAASGADTEPGVAVCRSVAAFSAWAAGRREEAEDHAARLRSVVEALPPWDAYTAERALFSFSVGDGWERQADRVAEVTAAIGAPSLLASARFYQATAKLYGPVPDAEGAAALHAEGRALARSSGAELSECQHLQGLVDALVAADAAEARAACADALRRMHELRYWLYLWRVADSAALLLARAGCAEEAALVLGHLDAHAPPWRSQPRRTTRQLLAEVRGADAWQAEGVALDRDEVVRRALAGLAGAA